MSAFVAADRLTVLLDIRQPHAYLALHPAAALAAECGVTLDWLPIDVPALKPPSEPGPDDDRGVRHRRYRAQALAREIETYADAQGLAIRSYYRDPDASAFHAAWLWVRQFREERLFAFLAQAFRGYWALGFDPSSEDAVTALFASTDASGSEFSSWRRHEGARALDALADELRERGLVRAPCYLVEDEVFVGRQHLPMIRWMLGGRVGPGPI